MSWLLIIVLVADGARTEAPVGLMIDQRACNIAGFGMGAVLSQANPGVDVGWRCEKQVAA